MSARFLSRCNFEGLGDAEVSAGRISEACRAFVYGHCNSKLLFFLETADVPSNVDLCFDAVIAGNITALKKLILNGRTLSARALAALFDMGTRHTLSAIVTSDVLDAGGISKDADLVAAVQIEKHVRRARLGLVRLNEALLEWGPAESRELVRLARMSPERSRETRTSVSDTKLSETMLFAVLAGTGGNPRVHDVARAARDAPPSVIAELLTYFPDIQLTETDAAAILSRPGFSHLTDRVINATKSQLSRYIFKDYGARAATLFLTRS